MQLADARGSVTGRPFYLCSVWIDDWLQRKFDSPFVSRAQETIASMSATETWEWDEWRRPGAPSSRTASSHENTLGGQTWIAHSIRASNWNLK